MFILLYMTLKMSFFAKVIRLSLFDDANAQTMFVNTNGYVTNVVCITLFNYLGGLYLII